MGNVRKGNTETACEGVAILRTKEESIADCIQQAAQSGFHQPDQNQPGEELDLAALKPKLKIPDYENYDSEDPRLGEAPARPKAAAIPPQPEQAAIKKQVSCDSGQHCGLDSNENKLYACASPCLEDWGIRVMVKAMNNQFPNIIYMQKETYTM